ncbi:MAG: alkaline phosphatase D family protein [Nitrososphaeraceae archaeon]
MNTMKILFQSFTLFSLLLITLIIITLNLNQIYGEDQFNSSISMLESIASGDVTNNSVILWSRTNQPSIMNIEYANNPMFLNSSSKSKLVNIDTDFTGHIKLNNLSPATTYFYNVWFSSIDNDLTSSPIMGRFTTAPSPSISGNSISFIVGGDIGGQTFCREVNNGYSIFEKMTELSPKFYIQNGDMIYADAICPKDRQYGGENIPGNFPSISDPKVNWNNVTQVHDIYLDHWIYNRGDIHMQNFLRNFSMYIQWDDHEVIDDFGANWSYWNIDNMNRTGYHNLVEEGRKSFFNFSPIDRNITDPNKIYRLFHWGSDLDLLILDARSDRSRNDLPDTIANNKTLLGKEQLAWLKNTLLNSDATWKVISSDVPLSIPTGLDSPKYGHDSWANGIGFDFSSKTGFERELRDLMKFIDDNDIKNIIFVTTDVHFPAILRYDPDINGDGDTINIYEIISGPLSAFPFGLPFVPILMPDPTFQPTILYVEGGIFNFSYIRIYEDIDGKSHLLVDIIGEDGIPRPDSHLELIT